MIRYNVTAKVIALTIKRAIMAPNKPCPNKTKKAISPTSKKVWSKIMIAYLLICPKILNEFEAIALSASRIIRGEAILIAKPPTSWLRLGV